MNIYKLEQLLKEVKAASKNPKISRKASWDLHCLAEYLESELNKLYFVRNIRKELDKCKSR